MRKFFVNDQAVWYLASPFSHKDPSVQEVRYEQVLEATTALQLQGHKIFSPIVYSYPLALNLEHYKTDVMGFEFWEDFDLHMIRLCGYFIVFKMEGWSTSKGLQQELKWAHQMKIPIVWLNINLGIEREENYVT